MLTLKKTGENEWFKHTNNLLFNNDSCHDICEMPDLHPICFGILLTYDYINGERIAKQLEREEEIGTADGAGDDVDEYDNDEYETVIDFGINGENDDIIFDLSKVGSQSHKIKKSCFGILKTTITIPLS